jgi:hypothetical protein
MSNERQRAVGEELNARFPKVKGNMGQQEFRMVYNMYRQTGVEDPDAYQSALASVRERHPGFTPIER